MNKVVPIPSCSINASRILDITRRMGEERSAIVKRGYSFAISLITSKTQEKIASNSKGIPKKKSINKVI